MHLQKPPQPSELTCPTALATALLLLLALALRHPGRLHEAWKETGDA